MHEGFRGRMLLYDYSSIFIIFAKEDRMEKKEEILKRYGERVRYSETELTVR